MTEKGRGGGDLVETFELHEITSLPYFRAPRSSERTGTYSACVLGVRLRCQRHDQLVFRCNRYAKQCGRKVDPSVLHRILSKWYVRAR
jgi:hypothetical protein